VQSLPVPPQRQEPLVQTSFRSQTVAQLPQWFGSVNGLWQVVPQQIWLLVQSSPVPPQAQVPVAQLSPLSQALLQAPQ
jgi:hypothetical protein